MKNLFIVTSALNSYRGCVSPEDRFIQTIDCLKNLKEKLEDDIILFTDGSPEEISTQKIDEIKKYVNTIFLFNTDKQINQFARQGKNNESEIIMLYKLLTVLKQKNEFRDFFADVKRIFKYSARSILLDKFNFSDYDEARGKYVFKKAIPSWMSQDRRSEITEHLYITRLYSFCVSLYEDYVNTLPEIFDSIVKYGIDAEHAHHLCIDKKKIIEFDNLHCQGILAVSGKKEIY